MPDTVPLVDPNCPAWLRNTVRHAVGMLSAIIPESCPSWAGARNDLRSHCSHRTADLGSHGLETLGCQLPAALTTYPTGEVRQVCLVPLHPSVTRALQRYASRRDCDPLTATSDAFFVFDYARPASTRSLQHAFRLLRRQLKWRARGAHSAPRIHDLRHTFVTRRLERWYSEGVDIEQNLFALSTYIGHAKVTDTYWYLTATPQLMAIAARRLAPPIIGGVS